MLGQGGDKNWAWHHRDIISVRVNAHEEKDIRDNCNLRPTGDQRPVAEGLTVAQDVDPCRELLTTMEESEEDCRGASSTESSAP